MGPSCVGLSPVPIARINQTVDGDKMPSKKTKVMKLFVQKTPIDKFSLG